MSKEWASYNSLMKHIREKGIEIHGSSQKNKLMNMGYYHGYKGYIFFKKAKDRIPYESFQQLVSVSEFDEELKKLLYLPLMQLETAIKSITCDTIVTTVKSSTFSDVFSRGLDSSHRDQCYRMRDNVYSGLTKRYQSSEIVKHFYNNDRPIPLWAVFEEMMLGDLSNLIEVLNPSIKEAISERFGIPKNVNTNGILLPKVILSIKDLRNAIAHNKVIFDGRYIEFKKRDSLKKMLSSTTGISNISFDNLLDDIILICFLLKNLKFKKTDIMKIGIDLNSSIEELKSKLPNRLFQTVTSGLNPRKIKELQKYLKSI